MLMLNYADHCLPMLAFEGPPPPGCPGELALVLVRRGTCLARHPAAAGGALAAAEGRLMALPLPLPGAAALEGHRVVSGVALCGAAPAQFAAALAGPAVCSDTGGLFLRLWQAAHTTLPPHHASALAYGLLCALSAETSARTPAVSPLVAAALDEIHGHYAEVYGVEELAVQLGVSKSHLIRRFTAELGTSPGRCLTAVRVENAKRLLRDGAALELVAGMCGFSGSGYLCKVFKKETGQTPRDWRRRNAPKAPPAPRGGWEEQMYL
jgi:AraC-like DNA-binding protein